MAARSRSKENCALLDLERTEDVFLTASAKAFEFVYSHHTAHIDCTQGCHVPKRELLEVDSICTYIYRM